MYAENYKTSKNLNQTKKCKGISFYGIKHVLKYLPCTSNSSIQYNLQHNSKFFTQIVKIILIFKGTKKIINTGGRCYIVNLSQPRVA